MFEDLVDVQQDLQRFLGPLDVDELDGFLDPLGGLRQPVSIESQEGRRRLHLPLACGGRGGTSSGLGRGVGENRRQARHRCRLGLRLRVGHRLNSLLYLLVSILDVAAFNALLRRRLTV